MAVPQHAAAARQESVDAYKKALELDPSNEQAALGMAWAYSYMKSYDESIKAFEKAMQLDPDLAADAYNGIGWAHFFKKDLNTAESFVAKAKAAGRGDARLAENIDRVRKGLEAKEREEAEPAPVPRVAQADAGTLSQILASGAGVGVKCKAARDIVKFGSEGVSALINALKDPNMDVRICSARALGGIGSPGGIGARVSHQRGDGVPERGGDPDRGGPEERRQVQRARQRRARRGVEDPVARPPRAASERLVLLQRLAVAGHPAARLSGDDRPVRGLADAPGVVAGERPDAGLAGDGGHRVVLERGDRGRG